MKKIYIALDDLLSLYSFPDHPFNNQRYFAFKDTLKEKDLIDLLGKIEARETNIEELLLFHTKEYVEFVERKEREGGYLDYGDTPTFEGIFKASKIVVGATLNCIDKAIEEDTKVFNPVGGLHHAFKDRASGFCVFNDICVGINYLRKKYKIKKILYFDIDAHHGDGVYYSFSEDPDLYIIDTHQKGIFPGTGEGFEKGKGKAYGTKINVGLDYGATDEEYFKELEDIRRFLNNIRVEFILFQAGCDSLTGDPITFLNLTENIHKKVIRILIEIADQQTNGRMVVLGGGGYSISNIKRAWITIIEELLKNR